MQLAVALLEELKAWRIAREEFDVAMDVATRELKTAVMRHGVESLQLYLTGPGTGIGFAASARDFPGLELSLMPTKPPVWIPPKRCRRSIPRPRAEACRAAFAALVPLAFAQALRVRNIRRLSRDYRETKGRAWALENVILPETIAHLAAITDFLDEFEQQEPIHIRNAAR